MLTQRPLVSIATDRPTGWAATTDAIGKGARLLGARICSHGMIAGLTLGGCMAAALSASMHYALFSAMLAPAVPVGAAAAPTCISTIVADRRISLQPQPHRVALATLAPLAPSADVPGGELAVECGRTGGSAADVAEGGTLRTRPHFTASPGLTQGHGRGATAMLLAAIGSVVLLGMGAMAGLSALLGHVATSADRHAATEGQQSASLAALLIGASAINVAGWIAVFVATPWFIFMAQSVLPWASFSVETGMVPMLAIDAAICLAYFASRHSLVVRPAASPVAAVVR